MWCLSLNEGKLGSWAHVISRLLWKMRARPVCLVHDRRCVARRNEVAHLVVRVYLSILCSGSDCRLFWYLYTHPIGMLYLFLCLDAALKSRFPRYHPLPQAFDAAVRGSKGRASSSRHILLLFSGPYERHDGLAALLRQRGFTVTCVDSDAQHGGGGGEISFLTKYIAHCSNAPRTERRVPSYYRSSSMRHVLYLTVHALISLPRWRPPSSPHP